MYTIPVNVTVGVKTFVKKLENDETPISDDY